MAHRCQDKRGENDRVLVLYYTNRQHSTGPKNGILPQRTLISDIANQRNDETITYFQTLFKYMYW